MRGARVFLCGGTTACVCAAAARAAGVIVHTRFPGLRVHWHAVHARFDCQLFSEPFYPTAMQRLRRCRYLPPFHTCCIAGSTCNYTRHLLTHLCDSLPISGSRTHLFAVGGKQTCITLMPDPAGWRRLRLPDDISGDDGVVPFAFCGAAPRFDMLYLLRQHLLRTVLCSDCLPPRCGYSVPLVADDAFAPRSFAFRCFADRSPHLLLHTRRGTGRFFVRYLRAVVLCWQHLPDLILWPPHYSSSSPVCHILPGIAVTRCYVFASRRAAARSVAVRRGWFDATFTIHFTAACCEPYQPCRGCRHPAAMPPLCRSSTFHTTCLPDCVAAFMQFSQFVHSLAAIIPPPVCHGCLVTRAANTHHRIRYASSATARAWTRRGAAWR